MHVALLTGICPLYASFVSGYQCKPFMFHKTTQYCCWVVFKQALVKIRYPMRTRVKILHFLVLRAPYLSYKATKRDGLSAETVKTEVPCQGLYGSKAEQRRSSSAMVTNLIKIKPFGPLS